MMTRHRIAFVFIAAAFFLPSCNRADPLAPPVIRYGEDQCAVCRMIISDDRYAAAVIALDEYQRHQHHSFDDIGCLFEYEAAHPDAQILARYVKDQNTRNWLDANTAHLVHSRQLQTPMAFGTAATETLHQARAIHEEFGGQIITLQEARNRFRAGTLHVSSLDKQHHAANSTPVLLESEKTIHLTNGDDIRLILHTPQIIPPGKHDFELTIQATAINKNWQVQIEPDMPSMGHGSPGNQHPMPVGDGRYQGLVNFTMPGPWVVHVSIVQKDAPQTPLGSTTFAFEVKR